MKQDINALTRARASYDEALDAYDRVLDNGASQEEISPLRAEYERTRDELNTARLEEADRIANDAHAAFDECVDGAVEKITAHQRRQRKSMWTR